MGKTIYSDNTDINGVNYATVGENIREGAKVLTYENIEPVLKENASKVNTALEVNCEALKQAIMHFFSTSISQAASGTTITFGGTESTAFTHEDWDFMMEILSSLRISAKTLRKSILYLFTGDTYYSATKWGNTTISPLTEEEKQKIKTFLGIS